MDPLGTLSEPTLRLIMPPPRPRPTMGALTAGFGNREVVAALTRLHQQREVFIKSLRQYQKRAAGSKPIKLVATEDLCMSTPAVFFADSSYITTCLDCGSPPTDGPDRTDMTTYAFFTVFFADSSYITTCLDCG
jgi:hypothetical protein